MSPAPDVIMVASVLASCGPQTPWTTIHVILQYLVEAVDATPIADAVPAATVKCLIPYFAPLGTRYGDPVPAESSADVHCTKSAGLAVAALASLTRKYRATAMWPITLKHLLGCWPPTLMALLFYSRALLREGRPLAMTEVDSPAYAFTAIVTLLQMYSEVESLAALVRSTPEALNLVAWLWSFEILNLTLSTQLVEMFPGGTQPSADGLLHRYLLVRRDFKEPSAAHSVFGNGPGAPRLATVALKHTLRTTLIVNQLGLNPFVLEQMRMSLRNLHALHSTHLHLHLLSQDSACVVTGALVALVSQPFDAASAGITADCITEICEYLALYIAASGISCLNRSLELGLLLALMRAHPWLDHKQSTFDVFTTLMSVHLPRYLIYLSVLRQVHKSFAAMQQVGMIGAVSNPCRKVWLAFEQYARVRLKLANDSELEVAPCDNQECNRPSSLRCSSCSNAVYCSKECQTKTWDSHSESCQSLINTRQKGIPPNLAQVDVQFALRVVQQDFEENKADICRRWTEAGTLPLTAGIDYSVFPHVVNIEPPSVVREQMRSDAVIFTVLPQGREGKEYYMCDLGLTRGADDTDEETVRVVVEMVGAQPVPAFFPIN